MTALNLGGGQGPAHPPHFLLCLTPSDALTSLAITAARWTVNMMLELAKTYTENENNNNKKVIFCSFW